MTFIVSAIWMKVVASILVAASGAVGAMMANRKVAVFNDAVRPIMGEQLKKQVSGFNPVLASTTFALCIGYVLGLLPLSIAKGVLLIHIILLMADIIGTVIPNHKKWLVFVAGGIGFAWGMGVFWGLQGFQVFLDNFTFPGFGNSLGTLGNVYNAIFGFFPAFVVALMFGWKKGGLALLGSLVVYIVTAMFLTNAAHLNATAMTLLFGAVIMFVFVIHAQRKDSKAQKKLANQPNQAQNVVNQLFFDNAQNIKKSKWYFVLSGVLIASAVAAQGMVGTTATIESFSQRDWTTALIVDGLATLGFIPLVTLTALATGVYSPAGVKLTTFFGVVGVTISASLVQYGEAMALIGILVAAVLGGLSMLGEVYGLVYLGKLLSTMKIFRNTGDTIRDSITRIINLGFLTGGVYTAMQIGIDMGLALSAAGIVGNSFLIISGSTFAGISVAIVGGIYLLNRVSKKPLPDFAIGPIGVLLSSVILNIIYWILIAAF